FLFATGAGPHPRRELTLSRALPPRALKPAQHTLAIMLKVILLVGAILAQAAGDPPIIDNDRVNVRERPTIGGPAGSMGRKTPNEIWISVTPSKAIVITLKDRVVAPIKNTSGYPNAFPRPGNIKVYEDARVIVWDYT